MVLKRNRHSRQQRAHVNLADVIDALREERAAIDELIAAVELLAVSQPKPKGRPPKRLGRAGKQRDAEKVIVFAARDIA